MLDWQTASNSPLPLELNMTATISAAPVDTQPAGPSTAHPLNPMTQAHVDEYWEQGYTIIRGVFSSHEIEQLSQACDRWKFTGQLLGRTWRRQNTVIWVEQEGKNDVVRGMQWPSYHDAVMDHFRTDARLLMILEPLIGLNIKQVINQLHWKKPGSRIT